MNILRNEISRFFGVFLAMTLCLAGCASAASEHKWDISGFGKLRHFSTETGPLGRSIARSGAIEVPQSGPGRWNVGILWEEERDIRCVEVAYERDVSRDFAEATKVQYWFKNWPGEPPRRHTIEDHTDDPWQGGWLTAHTVFRIAGNKVIYEFAPLSKDENRKASNLPGRVMYRRTLKIRVLYEKQPPVISALRVYSPTDAKHVSVRIQFGCDGSTNEITEGRLEIYNGRLDRVAGWGWDQRDKMLPDNSWKILPGDKSKGIKIELTTAKPELPGSNDLTIVTVRSAGWTFSFLLDDLDKGPIYIPAYSVLITKGDEKRFLSPSEIRKGRTVREKLRAEPEQTYDRARKDIPPLDVMHREDGKRLYLPLAADASWQKFAIEWGGSFRQNKYEAKAKGKELARCNWQGAELHWYIGTGEKPVYDRNDVTSQMSVLNDYLPAAIVRWNNEKLNYCEEAFVTLLEGPLSPYDPHRSEQTPAILMVKLRISNPTDEAKAAHIRLRPDRLNDIILRDGIVMDRIGGQTFLRACVKTPAGSTAKIENEAVHQTFAVGPHTSADMYISIPFVGDLNRQDAAAIAALDYEKQRRRVVSYWRDIVAKYRPFDVPERKFNDMSKSVLCHIRMSTTKDPKSGLFMVPAATFNYQVFANESAFQTIFLDRIGDHETAANYLETFLKLQGSVPMPGTFRGSQKAVLHGTRVDRDYNYTMGPYNLDHGTVLWALAQHYLLSGDDEWLRNAAPNMLDAADWIIQQRSKTKLTDENGRRVLRYGLLPAGRLEDNGDWGFWFANNAYAWLGLRDTAEAFKRAHLPEANRLARQADAYIRDLRTAVKRTSELAPVVRLRNNVYVPFVPSRVYQRFRYFGPMRSGYYSRYKTNTLLTFRLSATREVLYGPMILITTGVLEPHEPLSEAILDDWEDNITLSGSLGQHIHGVVDDEYWFSRGGMVFQPNLQNPIQAYLLRNEIPAAIRNIYNAMTSCLYPDVTAFTEEYRRWRVGSGPMYKIPDEARFVNRVCDMLALEVGNELWLASGAPRRWLEPGRKIEVYDIRTIFGRVAYTMRHGSRANTIEATVKLPDRILPERTLLFVRSPFAKPIKSVRINGRDWDQWDSDREVVFLPTDSEQLNIVVSF